MTDEWRKLVAKYVAEGLTVGDAEDRATFELDGSDVIDADE